MGVLVKVLISPFAGSGGGAIQNIPLIFGGASDGLKG
jgi:hypothetical protein